MIPFSFLILTLFTQSTIWQSHFEASDPLLVIVMTINRKPLQGKQLTGAVQSNSLLCLSFKYQFWVFLETILSNTIKHQ